MKRFGASDLDEIRAQRPYRLFGLQAAFELIRFSPRRSDLCCHRLYQAFAIIGRSPLKIVCCPPR
jgi:hypothetical protein